MCSISNELIKAETGLANQALIVVKIRAKNINCTGPWSIENEGNANIAACPTKMLAIHNIDPISEIRQDSITVNWTPITGVDAGGENIEIINYEIQYTRTDIAD